MPLSGLMGLVDRHEWNMPWLNQSLKPDQVVQFGIRDVDDGEKALMDKVKLEYYSPQEIHDKGLEIFSQNLPTVGKIILFI